MFQDPEGSLESSVESLKAESLLDSQPFHCHDKVANPAGAAMESKLNSPVESCKPRSSASSARRFAPQSFIDDSARAIFV